MPTKTTPKKAPVNRGKPAIKKAPPGKGGIAPASNPGPRGARTSVNLYGSDLDLLEPLRVHLRAALGLRVIRDSSLVQTVCRAFGRPGPEHVAALREVLALDGRR